MGYGFHEDGLKAGLAAASKLIADSAHLIPDEASHAVRPEAVLEAA